MAMFRKGVLKAGATDGSALPRLQGPFLPHFTVHRRAISDEHVTSTSLDLEGQGGTLWRGHVPFGTASALGSVDSETRPE